MHVAPRRCIGSPDLGRPLPGVMPAPAPVSDHLRTFSSAQKPTPCLFRQALSRSVSFCCGKVQYE